MNASVTFCTVVTRGHLPCAKVLAESLREHHPGATLHILLVEEPGTPRPEPVAPLAFHTLGDLALEDLETRAFQYGTADLCFSLKPVLLSHLYRTDDAEILCFLDSDMRLYAPLDPVLRDLSPGEVFLTPHAEQPFPDDGAYPDESFLLRAGTMNSGFLAVRRGPGAAEFLGWWERYVARECVKNVAEGHYSEQRILTLAESMHPNVRILRDPAINVAHWNLFCRHLSEDANTGRILVNGTPLRIFHFSGFRTREQMEQQLSRNSRVRYKGVRGLAKKFIPQPYRPLPLDNACFTALIADYVARCEAAREGDTPPAPFTRLATGETVEADLREIYRRDDRLRALCPEPFGDARIARLNRMFRQRRSLCAAARKVHRELAEHLVAPVCNAVIARHLARLLRTASDTEHAS